MAARKPQGKALPATRAEARAMGSARYFTGKPCINGHVDERQTKSGHCLACDRARQAYRLANDPVYRAKHFASSLRTSAKRRADPVKGPKMRTLQKVVALRRMDAIRAKKAEWNQLEEVKARRRELQRARYHSTVKIDPEQISKRKLIASAYAKANKAMCNAKTASRRFARKQATPHWLTEVDHAAMLDFYRVAQIITKRTGVKHDVDHVVPLNGERVCGLHTPWNLQVITAAANRQKANSFGEQQ